jgi:DNA-binding response OmpR family regulator
MLRVLIVDDDETLSRTIKRMLRGRFDVETASSARVAIDRVAECNLHGAPFDLIVCDARMPDGHGSEVLHAVRQSEHRSTFIMMSAAEAWGADADAYLAKPFTLNEFVDLVGELMSSRPSANSLASWRAS